MNSAIVYYSYSGNTAKIAAVLAEFLKGKYEIAMSRLEAQDESSSFFAQAARAYFHKKANISCSVLDLSTYDLICIGTPVWAFGPAPAVNAYVDKCTGVAGKPVVLFATHGSGAGVERCFNYMQDILSKKGAGPFKRFSIQQFKVNNKDFVEKIITGALK